MVSTPVQLASVAAAASLATAAASYSLHRLTRSIPTSSSTTQTPTDKNDDKKSKGKGQNKGKDEDEGDGKRFDTRREFYNPTTGQWDEADEDDSYDEDDEGKSKKLLFVCASRFWPKSSEYSDFEDYICVTLRSPRIIAVLRQDVSGLKDCEEVFEDKPEIDAKDLFLAVEDLRSALELKKADVEAMGKEDSNAKAGDDAEKPDEEEQKEDERGKGKAPTAAQALVNGGEDAEFSTVKPIEKSKDVLEEEIDHLTVLLEWVDKEFAPTKTKLLRLLHPPSTSLSSTSSVILPVDGALTVDGKYFHPQISFALLWAVFRTNTLAAATHELSGEKYALRVKTASYEMTPYGQVFRLGGTIIKWNGSKYVKQWVSADIHKFKGLRRLSTLSVVPLQPSSKLFDDLTARGKIYTSLTGDTGEGGTRFLRYDGNLMRVEGCGMDRRLIKLRAEGRAVIDVFSYRRMCPGRDTNSDWDDGDTDDPFLFSDASRPLFPTATIDSSTISPSELCLLPPTVPGFSLSLREWGELNILHFTPITFRSDAWEKLVLEQETKSLVKGLVECNSGVSKARKRAEKNERRMKELVEGDKEDGEKTPDEDGEDEAVVTDIIEGKGGGLVIALHGLPGVGKTLTAEAVAESLRVPLYTVGAGSLGVHADVLETRLRDTLDIAQAWGAVLLIDEADVFLEARSMHDIARNAMVSVFLRMLESHHGVLFLTTNRIRSIDEAFLSRFSLAVTYPNLDKAKRRHIWKAFLELAGVGIRNSSTSVNGDDVTSSYKSYIEEKYLDKLATYTEFNGRCIKNLVRTAQSLSISQRAPLGKAQLEVVVKASQAFVRDFQEADEKGVYEAAGEGWKDRTNLFN